MSGEKRAIVIMWTGSEVPDYLIAKIADLFRENGITVPELLKIVQKDQEAVAKCLVRDTVGALSLDIDSDKAAAAEAINAAVEFIGKRFEVWLTSAKGSGLIGFTLALNDAVSKSRNNMGFNILRPNRDDKALLNAVKILAESQGVIPKSLAKKYNITDAVIDVIVQVHNQYA